MEDFDSDVSSLTREYQKLPEECQNDIILADFLKRWEDGRKKLELKLNRGRI